MHIHQYQHTGLSYIPQVWRDAMDTRGKTGDEGDYYEFKDSDLPGATLNDFYLEQQAEIAAHYYEMTTYDGFPLDPKDKKPIFNGISYGSQAELDAAIANKYQPLIDEIRNSEPASWHEKYQNFVVTTSFMTKEAVVEAAEIAFEAVEDEVYEGIGEISRELSEGKDEINEELNEAVPEIIQGWQDYGIAGAGWESTEALAEITGTGIIKATGLIPGVSWGG